PLGYRAVVQVLGDLLQIKESKKVALRLLKETVRAGHLSQAARIVDELSKEEKTPRIVTIDTTGKLETIDPKSDHNVVKALRSLGGGL
ncbi:MAG: hypothetical protein KKH06_00195, partial [Gammaproteobacteria bacterium]|nr:hypothetical protein [Gammaproteobacteria bacterium]